VKPNYSYLKGLFEEIMKKNNYFNDDVFDWNLEARKIDPVK